MKNNGLKRVLELLLRKKCTKNKKVFFLTSVLDWGPDGPEQAWKGSCCSKPIQA